MLLASSMPNRLIRLACAAVFFAAAQGAGLGLKHCPHHDASAETTAAARGAPHHSSAGPASHAGATVAHGDGHEEGTPCTCLDECHAGSVTLGPTQDGIRPASSSTAPIFTTSTRPDGSPRGPRHLLFELHRPNAPPFVV